MFSILFHYPRVLARHRQGPSAQVRERYLTHRADQDLVAHFAACMRDQRGLSEVTIRNRCWHAQKFLNWLDGQNRSFGEVSLQELDAFLSLQAAQGWGRVSVATSAQALRSFFRHAEAHTRCAKGLAAGIDGPRIFKQEGLPMGPTWPDVERLLTSTRGDRPREIRHFITDADI